MKSLSDYTKILRSTATNLNLHGESVEMVVQMLANALYISEVEHVAYSQEASLERASQENSKIQHCVNQMYSVYRGANPRVIINFKASKLFTFKPHQEIIKSNNYTVYYLGYFSESTESIEYSDITISPSSSATIIGIMAKEVVTETWISGATSNPYYYTIPISDLSGDLYLNISGVRTDVTRIFSDHLKNDIPFDLTIPGYGLRLYYPESLQGELGYNTTYSLSVYKSLSLSDIQESERKALKMSGSQIVSFSDPGDRAWILRKLGAIESYPGIIFIPETPHDAIDTIHHKANRNRYAGSYLATNSDLSWLLQEYYPSKIRRQGVTYKFESPKSTTAETIYETKALNITAGDTSFLRYRDLSIEGGTGYLPEGEVKFKYRKAKEATGSNSSYEILPSASVIPVKASFTSKIDPGSENYLLPTISDLTFRVLKNTDGVIKLLTTPEELKAEGLLLTYHFPEGMTYPREFYGELKIDDILVSTTSDRPLEMVLTSIKNGVVLDREIIPFTYIPVIIGSVDIKGNPADPERVTRSYMTVTEEGPGDYYTLDIQDDSLYLKTGDEGEILGNSETIATLFYNGKEVTGVTYSLISSSDVEATIDPEKGIITITGMSEEVKEAYILIKARYNGMNFQNILVCKKTISNLTSSKSVSFSVYSDLSDVYPIITLQSSITESEVTIPIPRGKYKSLKVKVLGKNQGDIIFSDGEYTYSHEVIRNLIPSGSQTTPTLKLYYIPYSGSNPLNRNEITKFIENNKSYYITQDIEISAGKSVIAKFDISLDLYRNTSLDGSILEILQRYSYLFNQDFGNEINMTDTYYEIRSLITKISEVRNVNNIKITYLNSTTREEISYENIKNSEIPIYFIVECVISSIVRE